MGRKNNRMNKPLDKSFDKFIKNFMSEQEEKKQKSFKEQKSTLTFNEKENNYHGKRDDINYSERNKERLIYAKQQLDAMNISYRIIDEDSTLMYCERKSDGFIIKYYASSGFITGYPDFRGIRSLLMLLTQEV